jgi:hypothetical protein
MSNYRSMIDQALEAARARAHTPVETVKTASASDSLVKEASDLANALEFISMSAAGGDNAAGFRQEMIRDFYKSATSPAQGPTMASGVQGQAPSEGKKKLNPKGLVGGNSPVQTSTAPEAKDGEKTMLESFKQAESASLYDVLMGNKTAGMGGPAEHDSETSAGVTTANENSTYKQTLHTNEGPVNANSRDLKKSTRARLQEAFAHTSDTLGDATAAQIFPNAAAKGSLKIASDKKPSIGERIRGAKDSYVNLMKGDNLKQDAGGLPFHMLVRGKAKDGTKIDPALVRRARNVLYARGGTAVGATALAGGGAYAYKKRKDRKSGGK